MEKVLFSPQTAETGFNPVQVLLEFYSVVVASEQQPHHHQIVVELAGWLQNSYVYLFFRTCGRFLTSQGLRYLVVVDLQDVCDEPFSHLPSGSSVNDVLNVGVCGLQYVLVDWVNFRDFLKNNPGRFLST